MSLPVISEERQKQQSSNNQMAQRILGYAAEQDLLTDEQVSAFGDQLQELFQEVQCQIVDGLARTGLYKTPVE